jgi:very-short-patch-repair endonuclease
LRGGEQGGEGEVRRRSGGGSSPYQGEVRWGRMTKIYNKACEKDKRRILRNNMPKAELVLWTKLKSKALDGYKFRRQYSVGKYVVDFYCPKLKLAVEVDGDSHFSEGAERGDKERQNFIESFGISFLRFTNNDIYENLDAVLERIETSVQKRSIVIAE